MNIDKILETIKGLAQSQGLYGRIYDELMSIKEYDGETWAAITADLEAQNFGDVLDLVLFIEA